MTAYQSRSHLDLTPRDLRAYLKHHDTVLIPLGMRESWAIRARTGRPPHVAR